MRDTSKFHKRGQQKQRKHGPPRTSGKTKKPVAAPPRPMRAGLPARIMAMRLLEAVLDMGQPLDQAWMRMTATPGFEALEGRDRALVRSLVATVLRRQGEIEAVLKHFLEKPLPADKGRLWPILLLGAAQLCCLDMPAHAVVDLSVELARRDKGARRFDKLTNAVMRRVSERGKEVMGGLDAVALNVPSWLLSRWEKAYGTQRARAIAAASLREAPLDLTLAPQAARDAAAWAEKLGGTLLPTGSIRIGQAGRIEELAGYADGQWWVQDAAAALVVRTLGEVAGLAVADLCAAPGGKTASLAARGAKVTAVDVSEPRLKRLNENLQRLQLTAEVVVADVADWAPGAIFDAVLLDAPCSATGTIRRHPDLLRQKAPADIQRLAELQKRMLETAAALVKPGGMLVYSTCSLEPEEGEQRANEFLEAHPEFTREAIEPAAISGSPEWITSVGDLRTLPDALVLDRPELSGMDGFYAARLRKAG